MQEHALVAWANSIFPHQAESSALHGQLPMHLHVHLAHVWRTSHVLSSVQTAVEDRLSRGRLGLLDEVLISN